MLHKLQYISQGSDSPLTHLQNIEAVLNAGVKLVQLRIKNIEPGAYIEMGCRTKELCDRFEAQLIINDQPHVAKECGAQAVHLGLNDMSISEAKKIIPGKIIGGTANSFEDVKQRCIEKADYIGLGPYAFTTTKQQLSPVLGIKGYTDMLTKMRAENLNTPVYAIGGIKLENIQSIMETGVYGIAVSGLLTDAKNKEQLVKEINKILYHV